MKMQQENLHEILLWYRDMGADFPLDDSPINKFNLSQLHKQQAEKKPPQKTATTTLAKKPTTAKPAAPISPTIPDEQVVAQATSLATAASDLPELQKVLENFEGCNLKFTASKTVFADGNTKSPLMIIGEAPGREEDEQGIPFVGKAGQLLDKMLAAINRDRTNTYITNAIPWRPPGNRPPTPMESAICRPFVERHIELISPQIVLLMGGSAAKTLLQTETGILTLRGKWQNIKIGEQEFKALPTLHPAFLLRQPLQKRHSWHDLLLVAESLEK